MKKSLFRLADVFELYIAYIICLSLNVLLDYARTLDLDSYILKAFLKNFIDFQPLIALLFTFIVIVCHYQMLHRKSTEIFCRMSDLPQGTFEMGTLLRFAGYSFITSMPVLSFMLLISSRFENMWVSLGIGVAGFLSGMAMATSAATILMMHPFVVMLKPAVAMSAQPDMLAVAFSLAETLLFLGAGLWMAKNLRYE